MENMDLTTGSGREPHGLANRLPLAFGRTRLEVGPVAAGITRHLMKTNWVLGMQQEWDPETCQFREDRLQAAQGHRGELRHPRIDQKRLETTHPCADQTLHPGLRAGDQATPKGHVDCDPACRRGPLGSE